MLKIDNKTYRNLEEQVQKNKEDIARHYEVDRVLADWGIHVIGVVAAVENIPEGVYEYGDAYGLSSTSPMQYVVWTRANEAIGEAEDYWLNVGALSLVGPQGPQGIQGVQGPQGVRGSKWTSSSFTPAAAQEGNTGDQWLHTTTGDVYQKIEGGTFVIAGNIRGPQGVQGPTGPQGVQGIQGPQGPQGVKGDTGSSFQIVGLIASTDLLPTPTESNRHKAYAVGNSTDGYDLYVVIGEGTLEWANMGKVEGVEGPQGPIGPQGPAGADIQVVYITGIPAESTQGTLTTEQVNTLLAHDSNYIQFFNENFYPQDVETDLGYIVYSHVGQTIDGETKIKNISVTISTGGWVLTETSLVSAPITIVEELPAANEENFEKGKIYTQGELLQYISKVALAEPNLSQVNSLPQVLYNTSAAAVGTDIYIFGGSLGGASSVDTIYKYSTTTNTITTMSATLPVTLYRASAAAVGTDIYIFGGSSGQVNVNTIYKYSTTTNTITTLSTTLPTNIFDASAAAVGTDVYIFGGYSSSGVINTIYKYSTTTNTITTLSTTLPKPISNTSAAAVDTDIYIFGGYSSSGVKANTIYKYSTTTNTITTLSTTLPVALQDTSAAAVGTDIYIFGGYSSSGVNTIYKYSTTTNTITTLSTTLPKPINNTSAAAVGTDVYIFGGYSSSDGSLNTIYELEFGFTFSYKTIATE